MAATDDELRERFGGALTFDTREHLRGLLERRLLFNRCGACGIWIYPSYPICPECWSDDVTPAEVAGDGTIYLLTTLYQGRRVVGLDYASPTPVAAVELVEQPGLRYVAPVVNTDPAGLALGARVRLTWVERDGRPMPAFELS